MENSAGLKEELEAGASVARFLGVTTSLVNRYAASGELPLRRYA
jgi:hypothetical protein